ncbi:hypothetical protein C0Q70_04533 [Pomacea canaliculata]|uniref:Uncharacterized protein n=1 Tax=Pomacea canaliculata TaxID=400727 RepID=A0A2T7PIS0_POMCA|nr:hypothetical protein C0Q70_04533 [Pomacea canaliculata]
MSLVFVHLKVDCYTPRQVLGEERQDDKTSFSCDPFCSAMLSLSHVTVEINVEVMVPEKSSQLFLVAAAGGAGKRSSSSPSSASLLHKLMAHPP